MLLTNNLKDHNYKIFFHWTADTGYSAVFQDIVKTILDRHQIDPGDYNELAKHLDGLTDKLYEQFYIFTHEYSGVPFNPRFRRTVLHIFSEISGKVKECQIPDRPEHEACEAHISQLYFSGNCSL